MKYKKTITHEIVLSNKEYTNLKEMLEQIDKFGEDLISPSEEVIEGWGNIAHNLRQEME